LLIGVLVMLSVLTAVCIMLAIVLALLYRQVQNPRRHSFLSINDVSNPSVPLTLPSGSEYTEITPLMVDTPKGEDNNDNNNNGDSEWEKVWDEQEQRHYYHNKATGESKWDD